MINTVNKFKEQQSNSVKVLESLKIYLENGEKIGVVRVDSDPNRVRQSVRDSADAGSRSEFNHFIDRNG